MPGISSYLPIAAIGLAGTLLILLETSRYGTGISPDSVAYVSAARSLMSGHGFYQYDLSPFILWPPLYPTALALPSVGGIDLVTTARYLNAGVFGLLVFVTSLYLLRRFGSISLALAGSMALLFSIPLNGVATFAWSEPLFILFISLSLLTIEWFLEARRPSLLMLSGLLAALACLTRYAGLALIVSVVLLLVLDNKVDLLRRARHVFLFVSAPILLMAPWFARNFALSGTLMGERVASAHPFTSNVLFALNVMTGWFLPDSFPSLFRLIVVGSFLVPAIGAVVTVRWRSRYAWQDGVPFLLSMFVFIVVYVAYLIISASLTAFDVMDDRLLSPVYMPLVLLVFCGLASAQGLRWKRFPQVTVGLPLTIGVGIWLAYSLVNTVQSTTLLLQEGAGGYSTAAWHNSKLIKYLQQNSVTGRLFSNEPDAIYLFTAEPANWSPSKYAYNSPGVHTHDLDEFALPPPTSGKYFAWFAESQYPHLYNLKELKAILRLKSITEVSDGSLYRIEGLIKKGRNAQDLARNRYIDLR